MVSMRPVPPRPNEQQSTRKSLAFRYHSRYTIRGLQRLVLRQWRRLLWGGFPVPSSGNFARCRHCTTAGHHCEFGSDGYRSGRAPQASQIPRVTHALFERVVLSTLVCSSEACGTTKDLIHAKYEHVHAARSGIRAHALDRDCLGSRGA